ncbi:SURF1 family protein [Actinotalea sp. BY-33]|uniref:SURF1-like protein n=1 Tax=Actinotalea soli TaxID=2819234 RepID=A0A939RU69_9CELL|nr:SURF1 family protein [Actinotalea soli]MBO1752274.1 SURF1 family protein [Actinotalea soli]
MDSPVQPVAPPYLRTALSSRMLVLLVLLIGAAVVCVRLGVWQLDRAEVRGEGSAEELAAEQAAAPPTRLAELIDPGAGFRGELIGTKAEVSGTFEDHELLVAGRSVDGRTGYLLLTPFRVTGGEGPEPVLPVVRGWVAEPHEAAAFPAPTGELEVVGYLQAGESRGETGLPAGQIDAVSPAELVNLWSGPIYSGYLVLAETDPPTDAVPVLLPPPTISGGGLDLQNLAYAVQWWIFGGFALVLWLRVVRDRARDAVQPDEPDEPDGPDEPEGPDQPGGPDQRGADPDDQPARREHHGEHQAVPAG